jgi:hypothetical protein
MGLFHNPLFVYLTHQGKKLWIICQGSNAKTLLLAHNPNVITTENNMVELAEPPSPAALTAHTIEAAIMYAMRTARTIAVILYFHFDLKPYN